MAIGLVAERMKLRVLHEKLREEEVQIILIDIVALLTIRGPRLRRASRLAPGSSAKFVPLPRGVSELRAKARDS